MAEKKYISEKMCEISVFFYWIKKSFLCTKVILSKRKVDDSGETPRIKKTEKGNGRFSAYVCLHVRTCACVNVLYAFLT